MGNKRRTEHDLDSLESRGASRREFLAGAGLTGVVMAAGAWPALAPAVAEAAAGGGGLPMVPAIDARGVSVGRFALELDGVSSGLLKSSTGGSVYADVVNEKVGADHVVRKHIAGVKYEDFTLTAGTGMSKGFYDWIRSTFALSAPRKSGAVVAADFNYKELSRVSFSNALVTEVAMPALDAASKDPAYLTLTFSPESIKRLKGGGGSLPAKTTGV